MESTYGNKNHESRRDCRQRLKTIKEKALQNKGTNLIPAFSIASPQELLYELEEMIHNNNLAGYSQARNRTNKYHKVVRPVPNTLDALAGHAKQARSADRRRASFDWRNLEVIIDILLASKYTYIYGQLSPY